MAFQYEPPPTGALRQGEILGEIWEHAPDYPPIESEPEQAMPFTSIRHELLLVMSPDCDLDWDYKCRFPSEESRAQFNTQISVTEFNSEPKAVSHVFLAKTFNEQVIRRFIVRSEAWNRICRNQDERFHKLQEAHIGEPEGEQLGPLYIDFKKALAIPTHSLYEGIRIDRVKRMARIPPPYLQHLMHRYYGFLSRVALPD